MDGSAAPQQRDLPLAQCQRKQLALACKAAGAPDADTLAKIRPFTLRDFGADELYVRTFVIAHNAIDRDDEAFDEPFLDVLARTLPGKGAFERHPMSYDGDTGLPEGLWFEAYTQRMAQADARTLLRTPDLQFPPDRTDAVLLFAGMYMPVTDDNKSIRSKIDAGLGFVSVGFLAESRTPIKDSAGREMQARRIGGNGEALEASLVWLGAQPGARAVKSAHTKGDPMDLQKLLDAANAELATTKSARDAAQTKATAFDQLEAVLGADFKSLLDNPAALKAVIEDGKAYRSDLVDEVVALQRGAKVIHADTDDAVASIKSGYAGLPLSTLKSMRDALVPKTPAAGTIPAGDPNAPTGARPNGAGNKAPDLIAGAFGTA
jgi:hypothetical protein